jgi:hypothetical protein
MEEAEAGQKRPLSLATLWLARHSCSEQWWGCGGWGGSPGARLQLAAGKPCFAAWQVAKRRCTQGLPCHRHSPVALAASPVGTVSGGCCPGAGAAAPAGPAGRSCVAGRLMGGGAAPLRAAMASTAQHTRRRVSAARVVRQGCGCPACPLRAPQVLVGSRPCRPPVSGRAPWVARTPGTVRYRGRIRGAFSTKHGPCLSSSADHTTAYSNGGCTVLSDPSLTPLTSAMLGGVGAD